MAITVSPKIKSINNPILVKPVDEEKDPTKGDSIIPVSAKDKPKEAKIVASGTGDDGGKTSPSNFWGVLRWGEVRWISKITFEVEKQRQLHYTCELTAPFLAVVADQ